MKLSRFEIKLGFFPGILFGIRNYEFRNKKVRETDIVIYFGMIQLIITLIYNKQDENN